MLYLVLITDLLLGGFSSMEIRQETVENTTEISTPHQTRN